VQSKQIEEIAMKKENLLQLQLLLESQRKALLGHGRELQINYTAPTDERFDEVDLASSDLDQGMTMRMGNRESLYFKKVEEALLRIKEGTYGICSDCGAQISLKRLEARPTAELCIECKEAAERRENLSAEGRKPKSVGEIVNFKA
jgi:DnaK suppressor protein